MNYQTLDKSNQHELAELFNAAFTTSEGEKEGALIGQLASELGSGIDNHETICFGVYDNATLIGALFFTRLKFKHNPIQVYMLAPVAVSPDKQGIGIGQDLIRYGLDKLRDRSVSIIVTYGDPSFYAKVGFQRLPEELIQAPLKLSMPFGWLGQSLTGAPIPAINERPLSVKAFNDPVYW